MFLERIQDDKNPYFEKLEVVILKEECLGLYLNLKILWSKISWRLRLATISTSRAKAENL